MDAKPLFHTMQAAEKVYDDFTLTAHEPRRPLQRAAPRQRDLRARRRAGAARALPVSRRAESDVTRRSSTQSAKVEKPGDRGRDAGDRRQPERFSGRARLLSTRTALRSMLRTTCVATRLAGGHAYNALPQTATANVNCRIVPTSSARGSASTLDARDRRHGDQAHATPRPTRSRIPEVDAARSMPALLSAVDRR